MTEAQIQDIGRHRESDAFDELEKLVLDFALALTDTPANVPDALFRALRKHLDEAQMIELAAAVSFENYLARFNRAFDLRPEAVAEGAVCPLPDAPLPEPK